MICSSINGCFYAVKDTVCNNLVCGFSCDGQRFLSGTLPKVSFGLLGAAFSLSGLIVSRARLTEFKMGENPVGLLGLIPQTCFARNCSLICKTGLDTYTNQMANALAGCFFSSLRASEVPAHSRLKTALVCGLYSGPRSGFVLCCLRPVGPLGKRIQNIDAIKPIQNKLTPNISKQNNCRNSSSWVRGTANRNCSSGIGLPGP